MRSPCPVTCSLDLIGDKWTLVVIRDLFLGRTRFKDFTASPEGIPTNILTERLDRLCAAGLVEKAPVAPGAKRYGYGLTAKGRDLKPVLVALANWGLKHIPGTAAKLRGQSLD